MAPSIRTAGVGEEGAALGLQWVSRAPACCHSGVGAGQAAMDGVIERGLFQG